MDNIKPSKIVDNVHDILYYIVTILGTGLGFAAVISGIINQMHLRCGALYSKAWIFGLIISFISLAVKIISNKFTNLKW